jgi:hypothetical protein
MIRMLIAFALAAAFAAGTVASELTIFADGAYKAGIVLPAAPNGVEKLAEFDAAFKALADYRASVEGDFVCDYSFHANWERMFVGWPHKVRKEGSK